ncbi:LacI family DNA-binding transcriptional regulator [Arthrobacter sp. SAFR-014]|uniref:LacI family DNA-binding transcriptional regulator n=1 Tax=unclassified Arthrobacter TaxID=235627 RepID=UPI003F7CAA4E
MSIPSEVRPPSIGDVARVAGVSVPTVSRVLTGKQRVSSEKTKRVHDAIAQLGYRPNSAARALVSGRGSIIGVIAGNTSRYGYASAIQGVEEAARAAGYTVVITVVESTQDTEVQRAVDLLLGQQVAGIVVLKFDPPGVAALRALPAGIPVAVMSGTREARHSQAVFEEAKAAAAATRYLLDLGHETVHHVAIPPSRREDGRTQGWRKALKDAGARVPPVLQATWEPASAHTLGKAIANRHDVTALFCGNDDLAIGLISGLAAQGKTVPQDFSVVGFDDHPLARFWLPPLTTVSQDFVMLGHDAFRLLMRKIAGDSTHNLERRLPELIIRQTAAAPRASVQRQGTTDSPGALAGN